MSSVFDINPYDEGMRARVEFGEWLLDQIVASEMTQEDFARIVGASQGSVSGWVNGKSHPDPRNLAAIALALDCDVDDLRQRIRDDRARKGYVSAPKGVRAAQRRTAVYLLAGVPADRMTWVNTESERRMIELPESWLTDVRSPAMAVTVRGDCLTSRGIFDGDLVICEPVPDPRSAPQGKIVLVRIGEEYTLKVWVWVREDMAELRDGHGTVVATITDGVDFEILGVARKRFGDVF